MERKTTVKLRVVFASQDLLMSPRDAIALKQELEKLLDALKPQSRVELKQVSIHSNPLPAIQAMVKEVKKSD